MSAVLIVLLALFRFAAVRYGCTRLASAPLVEFAPSALTDCFVFGHQPLMVAVPGCRALARTENERRSWSTVRLTGVDCDPYGLTTNDPPSTHQSDPERSAISLRKPKSLSACRR